MAAQEGEIVNKVKQSDKLVTVDLQNFYDDTPIFELDLKDFLYKDLILKENEFRQSLEQHKWKQYRDAYLAVFCSSDAIIAKWAYMLVARHAREFTRDVFVGRKEEFLFELYRRKMDKVNWPDYRDKFVLLKGCSDKPVPESVYVYATNKLIPHVKKLMYGEACSNVPIFRK